MASFTAIGRSFGESDATRRGHSAMEALGHADSMGHGAPNLLPVRFHDDSILSIPVLRPEDIEKAASSNADAARSDDGAGGKPSFFHRKSTSGASSGSKQKFSMREVTRRDYLAHYAKDSDGQYAGTEEPAADCILRGEDLVRYRSQKKDFGAGVDDLANEVKGGTVQVEDKNTGGKGFLKGFRSGKGRSDDTVIR